MLHRQAGLFNSAVTSHEDTLENISSAAGLIIGGGWVAFRWSGRLCWCTCPVFSYCQTHTHAVPSIPKVSLLEGPQHFIKSPPHRRHRSTPASQIMLCHDVPFPFYVNTSYQPRMCQHKLLAPLLEFRLPHYPDLSRIKLSRLEWASPHSWYESAQSAQNKLNPLCTAGR